MTKRIINMIGYKATYNGKCKNKTYKLGKTYTLRGKLIMCIRGFHFCQDLYDVFTYYSPNKHTKVFKVETLGNIETEGDKSVTDKIKILEEVNLSNLIVEKDGYKKHFDDKCNYIKYEDATGYWTKYEYNSNNDLIKEENFTGYWIKYEYDSNNNKIKRETSNGSWGKFEYDENNNKIKEEYSTGYWWKYEYDKNNNRIKEENSTGYWTKYEYSSNNDLIKEEHGKGQSI